MMTTIRKPENSCKSTQKRKLYSDDTVSASSDSCVKVVVRVKAVCNDKGERDSVIQKFSSDSLSINGHNFTFDSVAHMDSTQLDMFELIGVPLVENCLTGFNSSVFAYGQTGSGKTYAMWGPTNSLAVENSIIDQQGGLAPRVFERLFVRINEEQTDQLRYQCHCSFLEIYNEHITDLLDPNKRNLQIREDVKSGIYVENLTERHVSTVNDVNQLLIKGLLNTTVGATSVNSESSRSHTVFTCVVESQSKSIADCIIKCKTSKINLVDLAGSERQKSTVAAGNRLKEAGNINRSLSQLGNLINILAEVSQTGKQRHIPYRDSKLTFLLQESLGGNAKLTLLCAISPAQRSETFCTLKFAQRGKAIKNKAVVNEVMNDDVSLTHEHELLMENYEHHPKVLKKIELKRVKDELQKYQNYYEQEKNQRTEAESRWIYLSEELRAENEANRLLAEKTKRELDTERKCSKELKNAIQIAIEDHQLLKDNYEHHPDVLKMKIELKRVKDELQEYQNFYEQERNQSTEAECRQIYLSEELKAEVEANRSLAEKIKRELDAERKCSKELKDAMQIAIEDCARILEQYADLEEKHDQLLEQYEDLEEKHVQLLERHGKIHDGIDDVKKATSEAGIRSAESKLMHVPAAEISALKAAKEEERRIIIDKNRGLQYQSKDSCEAVQVAGELVVPLKEAEEGAVTAQDQPQIKTRQPIKLSSSLTKLTNLELTEEKKRLMKTSIFYKLTLVENSKESSSTLIASLLQLYDPKKQSNPRILRSCFWLFVKDLKVFEQINWAKAVFDHICESLKDLKEKMRKPGEHCFKGAAPVLEALIYERIPSMRPPVKFSDPLIQKYSAQRRVGLKLDELTAEQINVCPWCNLQDLSLVEGGAPSQAPFLVEDEDLLAHSLVEDDACSLISSQKLYNDTNAN